MSDTALIIIDVQNNYFKGGFCELCHPEETSLEIKKVLEHFRKTNQMVVHVRHNMKIDGGSEEKTKELLDIHKNVYPIEGEVVIHKDYPSSFLKTNLQEELQKNSIKKLVIVGMMSHMCVDTTVRAAQNYDYEVIVLSNGCTTKDINTKNGTVDGDIVHEVYIEK